MIDVLSLTTGFLRGELAKIRDRLFSSPCGHERVEDSRGRVDGNLLAFPFGVEEPLVCFGHVLLSNQPLIETENERSHRISCPIALLVYPNLHQSSVFLVSGIGRTTPFRRSG